MAERAAFRPDLEGLRGVAILLVVAFHAGMEALAGGFVGVDVFFVLSGYFITGMLAREFAREGRIDVGAFWGGRAMRLLPALLVVLLFTLATVMWLYAPIDRPPIASGARAAALYSANVEFARTSVDYFRSAENPLLHTWSLAVEEQFYLVWPLLFILLAVRTAAWSVDADDVGAASRGKLRIAMALLGFLSFGIAIWLTRVSQPWAFYGMGTRLWEFALGGVLALTLTEQADEVTWPATLLSVIGMVAIAIAAGTYDRGTPYPGMAALLPALGAVAIIVGGGRAPDSWPSRALSTGWLRWLGRMSYAWYLWHWPLIGLGGVIDWNIGLPGRLAWSGVALVLAYLTHRWIESPAREGQWAIGPRWLAPAALAASVGAAVVAHNALRTAERQLRTAPQKTFASAREDRMEHGCWGTTLETWPGGRACEFGDTRSATTLVLLGDSHAEHWLGALDRIGKERGWKIVAMVKGGCPVADMRELRQARLLRRWYGECARFRDGMIARILEMRPNAVLLSSWDHYVPLNGHRSDWQVTPDVWERGLRRTYARLTQAGLTTLAMRGTPRTWFDVPQCLSRRDARLPFARACVYARSQGLSQASRDAQDRAARGLPVRFVDMNDQICATSRCGVTRNGIVMFTDDNHLTASFSRSLAPVLGDRLGSLLSQSGASATRALAVNR